MKYSIIITTYNHCDDLLKPCIESILRNTIVEDMEIIVVANGCTDNTREYVESLGEPLKLLWFDEPLGYTPAANRGIEAAQGEYIIMMNNDVIILDWKERHWWVDALEAPFLMDDKVGVTGPSRMFSMASRRYFIIFYLAMIKREMFEKFGLYDEIFTPGCNEDIDFCHRIEDAGYKTVQVPEDKYEWKYGFEFPAYHIAEGTMHSEDCIWQPTYNDTVKRNDEILKARYFKHIKYSIIIPTYNHCDDLLKPCLESIRQNTNLQEQRVEVIVVANGCTDNTASYVNALGYPFRLLSYDEPMGYTRATNEGIKAAEGEYVILLNNDTTILDFPDLSKGDWIRILEDPFLQDDTMGLTGPSMAYCHYAEHDFLIFFCVMIKKRLFDEIGLLDDAFSPGFGEDSDFAAKARRAGYKLQQVPNDHLVYPNAQHDKFMGGNFPIFHVGEETFKHEDGLQDLLRRNSDILAERYGSKKKEPTRLEFDASIQIQILEEYQSEFATEIYAINVLQHINPYNVHAMLCEWHRILKSGGRLIIEVPDVEKVCEKFGPSDKAQRYDLLNLIYDTSHINNPTFFGWYEDILLDHLHESGFSNVQKTTPQSDASLYIRIEAQK